MLQTLQTLNSPVQFEAISAWEQKQVLAPHTHTHISCDVGEHVVEHGLHDTA